MPDQTSLLEVRDLCYRHPGSTRPAVDNVSIDVEVGRTLALVGESGSGKSTLVRLVAGLLRPDAGSVTFNGRRVDTMTESERRPLRVEMGTVFQDPAGALNPRETVLATLSEPFTVHRRRMSRVEIEGEVLRLCGTVGMGPDLLHRFPHELSGGQRQRVSIARALALKPRLVLLDEPTSALDVSVQAQILNLLMELQSSLGLAYLFVSHDLAVVAALADRIGVMQGGRLLECNDTGTLLARPHTDYTRALLDAYSETCVS